ncbi:hypothetical protein VQH23_04545 [Pararoseomonas sp. SCSIO 73927]|uniref:hypothetical protein n=1 Tax=Pararoseomonas sp. SCSIO 73927 TaxID=3114537 RepID=UPI0030CC45A8
MARTERERADFETAMGESFADAICPPIPFEEASPHECCEAIRSALGREVTPELLARLPEARLAELSESIGHYFGTAPPTVAQIRAGLDATLARWPAR